MSSASWHVCPAQLLSASAERGGTGQRAVPQGRCGARAVAWEALKLLLYRLRHTATPEPYRVQVWRRLKGFLMPRRFYDSLAEFKRAVLSALSPDLSLLYRPESRAPPVEVVIVL